MAKLAPKKLIAAVRSEQGEAGLSNLAPVAYMVSAPADQDPCADLLTPSMLIEPVVHPVVEALLLAVGATRRGQLTFSMGLGKGATAEPLDTLLSACAPGSVLAESYALTATGRLRDLSSGSVYRSVGALREIVSGTVAAPAVTDALQRHLWAAPTPAHGVVLLSSDGRNIYFKFHTLPTVCPAHDQVRLDLRPGGQDQRDPRPLRPAVAVAVAEWLAGSGYTIVDPSPHALLASVRQLLASTLVAWPMPGRPARAQIAVGTRHAHTVESIEAPATGHGSWTSAQGGCSCTPCTERRAYASHFAEVDAVALAPAVANWPGATAVAPAVADTAALAAATPVDDPRLRAYQCEIVGMHLATEIGFVNAISPGMGKTICVLDAYRRRAATTTAWRGLVVLEANVRRQWATEAAQWFPQATVVVVESAADAPALAAALARPEPVLVLCSYALAAPVADRADRDGSNETPDPADTSLAALLDATAWDDLAADEAACLRNASSKQSRALWRLRQRAQVAVALTGTPITRSLDDVDRLICWVRNDTSLFTGARLSKTIDLSTAEGRAQWGAAVGPLLVRRDKSEIAAELPGMRASVVHLDPSPAERALAYAARNELKRVYEELVAATARAQAADPSSSRWTAVREQLAAARGAWLGGTQLARMAASDPATIAASESAGAALLAAQGLVEAATAATGTKRTWVLGQLTTYAAANRPVLVFTEFASVARGLLADLAAAGIPAGGVLGGGGRARDAAVADFTAGRLPILVSTASGERGLNLQQAQVVIHYDLPWTPDAVLQRTGRVERIGAQANEIEVVFPVMRATVEERVAALVVARALTAMCALDVARGVDATVTDMGRALGQLAGAVDATVLDSRESSLLAMTRDLLAA